MDIVTILVGALIAQGVKVFMGADREEAGISLASGAAEQIVRALLATADEASRSLDRIESKLDAVLVARYRDALSLGYRNLQAAEPIHRSEVDRTRLLDLAVQQFSAAAVAAPTRESGATAELLAGTAWLARGSVPDFVTCARAAADEAFAGVLEAVNHLSTAPDKIPLEEMDFFSRLRAVFAFDAELKPIRARAVHQAKVDCDEAMDLFNKVQDFRRRSGTATASQAPRMLGYCSLGKIIPNVLQMPAPSMGWGSSLGWGNYVDPALDFGDIPGQSVHLDSPRVTSVTGGYVVDAAVHLRLPRRVSLYGPSSEVLDPLPDVTADQVGYLPAQLGHTLWHGESIEVDAGQHSLALRFTKRARPDRIFMSVEGIASNARIENAGRLARGREVILYQSL